MKKLLVLAMVLVFAAMPAFAEMNISGEFDYYMINGFDKDNGASFADKLDKLELDFAASVGDYSTMKIELEEDGSWNSKADNTWAKSPEEGAPSFNYAKIITDWGKFFGLENIGIKTTIGLDSWETFDKVDFTGYNYEYADNWWQPAMDRNAGFKLELSFVDGLVQPYYAMEFDTVDAGDDYDNEWTFLAGIGFDFNAIDVPLWLELYFEKFDAEDCYEFGAEAAYTLAIDEFTFKIGGWYNGFYEDSDYIDGEVGNAYGAAISASAYGATLAVGCAGLWGDDYFDEDMIEAFSVLSIEAEYMFLDWLGLNAGVAFAFGDYKENAAGDEAVQNFSVGAIVKPSKGVVYKIGYIYIPEDVADADAYLYRTLNSKAVCNEKGGLYFTTKIDF
ncbi:MAG: hypothetical protein MJ215_06110 [Spirochaetia bacterium]|nr:hypothetical protein [Spirochaetia bacterium]